MEDAKTTEEIELEKLRKELAEAQAKRDEARDRRELRKTPQQLRAEIAAAQREADEIDKLTELEAQYGEADKEIRRIESLHGMIVVKRPAEMAYRKFADMEKMTTSAAKEIALHSLVYPDKKVFNEWASEEPAIIARAANAACWLAGNRKELDEKK